MAARGLASRLDWQPIRSGVRVTFGGPSPDVREVMIREEGTNVPVPCARSYKAKIELPVRPGKYALEVSVLTGGKWADPERTPVTVAADKVTRVTPGEMKRPIGPAALPTPERTIGGTGLASDALRGCPRTGAIRQAERVGSGPSA